MTMEKRLSDVEASIKIIAEYVKQQTDKIEKEMVSLKDSTKEEPLSDASQDLEELKRKMDMLSAEKGVSPLQLKKLDDFEQHINQRIEKLEGMTAVGSEQKNDRSAQSVRADFDNFRREISPKIQFVDSKMDKLNAAVNEAVGSMDLDDLKNHVDGIDKKLNDTLAMKSEIGDVEKNLAEMKIIANRLKDFNVDTFRKEFDKHIDDMADQFKSKMEHMEQSVEEVEELDVDRISLEKRVRGIEMHINEMRRVVGSIQNMEGLDMSKLSNRINDMESNMKMQTVRLLTQQLNEFTKSLDRRLPNIVSREEYLRQITDINQRMRTIEAPDLSPLGARVGRLEKKIEEISVMMRSMYNRIPIVVE